MRCASEEVGWLLFLAPAARSKTKCLTIYSSGLQSLVWRNWRESTAALVSFSTTFCGKVGDEKEEREKQGVCPAAGLRLGGIMQLKTGDEMGGYKAKTAIASLPTDYGPRSIQLA